MKLRAHEDAVVTRRLAYDDREVSLCAACEERGDHGAGPLGPVQVGLHAGYCGGARHGEEAARMKPTNDACEYFAVWAAVWAFRSQAEHGVMDADQIIGEAYRIAERGDAWARFPFMGFCDCADADKAACEGHGRRPSVDEAIDYLTRDVDDGCVRGYLPLEVAARDGIRASRYGVTIELSAAEVREAVERGEVIL